MKGLKNFLILTVFVVLTAVGLSIYSISASGTILEMFKLGKQLLKILAVLTLPLGLYFVAKQFT